jgi:hypothetical protein
MFQGFIEKPILLFEWLLQVHMDNECFENRFEIRDGKYNLRDGPCMHLMGVLAPGRMGCCSDIEYFEIG